MDRLIYPLDGLSIHAKRGYIDLSIYRYPRNPQRTYSKATANPQRTHSEPTANPQRTHSNPTANPNEWPGQFPFLGQDRSIYSHVRWIDQSIHVSVDRSIYPRPGIDDRTGPENLEVECRKNKCKSSHLKHLLSSFGARSYLGAFWGF